VKILARPLNHSEHIALKQLCVSQGEQCKPFHVHFFVLCMDPRAIYLTAAGSEGVDFRHGWSCATLLRGPHLNPQGEHQELVECLYPSGGSTDHRQFTMGH
jgi:hypothetical protein